ncbi:MAG: DUF917 domain-containing protein, partial [Caulobacterales bacterium]|nr:DUF917 domain-containing protein [Caulobacterales bacterium]
LGTGGGGDPYYGRLMAMAATAEHGFPRIISVEDVANDALIVIIAMLGAPTVLVEKAISGADVDLALLRIADRCGRRPDALMPVEIGGVNSTMPIMAAARSGLPLVNADGMGRAFPSVQMTTMNFEGVSACPFVAADEHGTSLIIDAASAVTAENMVRVAVMQMGLACVVAGYPMSGAQLRGAVIPNTLTAALSIGRAIKTGRRDGRALDALLECVNALPVYGRSDTVFQGKIVDVERRTTGGFAIGQCLIEASDQPGRTLTVRFQNEFLLAREGEAMLGVVPDLVSLVDAETAEPIPVESLRFGQRVAVIVTGAPDKLKTSQALKHVHPTCFGLDVDYTPFDAGAPVPAGQSRVHAI